MRKLSEAVADEPTVIDLIRRGRCDLVINTPEGADARSDGYAIREAALSRRVPCITTMSGAAAAVHAIANARAEQAVSLQERIDAESANGVASPRSRRSGRTRCCALERGGARSRRARAVLHARGAGTAAAAADVAVPRAAGRARVPHRPGRAGNAGAVRARAGRRDPRLRPARQRLPARRRAAAARRRRDRDRAAAVPRRAAPQPAGGARLPHAPGTPRRPRSLPNAEVVRRADARHRADRARRCDVLACGPEPMLAGGRAPRARTRSSRGRRRWRAATAPATAAPSRSTAS